MAAEASRGSLARVVEAALHFFGVANVEQLEGLLDDTEQRAMLRNWLRSVHCPRDAAGVVDSDTHRRPWWMHPLLLLLRLAR